MKASKQQRLKARGWKVGTAKDFLALTPEEVAFIEVRLALARLFAKRRIALGQTQQQVAARLGSSQSRIAKLEAGDPSVTVDLMIKSLLALGASRRDLGRAILASREKRSA